MKRLVSILLALSLLTLVTAALAEASWPTKTINVICTHGAGGDTDFNARLLSRLLEQKLGVSVVVTNVVGSNGNIAMAQYKDGDKDGYTFVMTNTAALTGNEVTGISDFGFDSFEPVCIYGRQAGENIIVPAGAPYDSLEEMIAASKEAPGTITFGISTGGGVYIAANLLKYKGGAEFNFVDTGDAAARLASLLGGHVNATIVPYSTASEYVEAGQVKALCTLLEESPSLIPGIPAANDTVEGVIINTLYACLAPKGTPAEIVEAMNAAILDVVNNDPEYKQEVNSYNFQEPWALSVADTVAKLTEQRDLFMSVAEYLK